MTRPQRLAEMAAHAVRFERSTGYPADVIVAQWAVESAWGTRQSGRNNLFGMTYRPRHSGFSWVPTREELTAAGIAALPAAERATITSQTPMPNRPGFFNVRLKRRFADYATVNDSIQDKVSLVMTSPRYAAAWTGYLRNRNVSEFIDAIAAAGYATAGNYMTLVKQIAGQKNVRDAIAKARSNQ